MKRKALRHHLRDNKLNSPLTIGIAKFTGGEILKGESFGSTVADATAVYATTGFGAGYTDPLVITFSQAVSNVSLTLTNELPDTYTLTDSLGKFTSLLVGNDVNQNFSLTDAGVTQVTLSTVGTVGWDFAIDNVSFTATPTSAPEPLTAAPVAVVLIGLSLLKRRRRLLN